MEVTLNANSELNKGEVFNEIFHYYIERASVDADTPYQEVAAKAKDFLETIDEKIQAGIYKSEYRPSNDLFIFEENVTEYQKYSWLYGFQNFYRAINNLIIDYTPSTYKQEGAEAQYVLGRDAFKHIGHNASKVQHSSQSYASTFYH